MKVALYAGSFDPLTNGHLSIIQRGLQMFDKILVAIATNPKKSPLFTGDEKKQLILEATKDPRVEVDDFQGGLLVEYARKRGIKVMLRGLRAVSDFDYEFQLASMNRKLAPDIDTVFLMTGEDYFYVSSSLVREVASFGGNVEGLVPPNVLTALQAKYAKK